MDIPTRKRPAITIRAICLGALLCAFINISEPYLIGYVHTSPMSADFSTGSALFLLFVLSLMINLPMRWLAPKWAFEPGELLVCFIMMIVACAIPTWGFSFLLIPWLAAPTYYATPGNQWEERIIPKLPDGYFMLDTEAARQFFEGLKEDENLPWELWIEPLSRWALFIMCFYIASVSLMVILRRQWIHNERLNYPLTQMPLALIPTGNEDHPPAYCKAAFWIGVAIPAVVYSFRGLHEYYPDVPVIQSGTRFWMRNFLFIDNFREHFRLNFYFEVIGLSFLLGAEVALSLWLFAFLAFIEQGIMHSIGYRIGPIQPFSGPGGQEISNQALGAMIVFVVIGLWRARKHFWATSRAAIGAVKMKEEDEEIISYRFAYSALVASCCYLLWWWHETGLGAWAPLLGFWFVILFVGLTKAVVQGGMAYARSPVVPAVASMHSLGISNLGEQGVIGLAMTGPYAMDTRTTVMTSTANALRLAEELPTHRKRLGYAIMLALVVSLIAAFAAILYIPYEYGCSNLSGWGFNRGWHQMTYNWAGEQITEQTPLGMEQFIFMGVGAVLMVVLTVMQMCFHWWPIHPVGLTLGYTWPVANTWFSVFLAWLFKTVLVRIGGRPLYMKARPMFIGLAVGGFVTAGFWAIAHAIVGHGAVSFTLG